MKTTMKKSHLIFAMLSFALAGCSAGAGLLDPKASVPSANAVPVGNPLVLPPDLQLASPTATADGYQPNGSVAPPPAAATKAKSKTQLASLDAGSKSGASLYGASTAPASKTAPDIFEQYGISKLKADGTAKSPQQLREELSAAILKKKREKNPNYGTAANIGAIFKDQ